MDWQALRRQIRKPAGLAVAGISALLLAGSGAFGVHAALTSGTGSPSPTPSASPTPTDSAINGQSLGSTTGGGGGAKNIVLVSNRTDDKLRAGGRVQLSQTAAANVAPANIAMGYSQCVNCQTLAIALQINLFNRNTTDFHPQNAASATNFACTGCTTIAVAYQYNIGVDNPDQYAPRVHQLAEQMNAELRAVNQAGSLSEAIADVNNVIGQFSDLAAFLITSQDQTQATTTPGATPLPATPSPSGASGSPPPAGSGSPSPNPSASPAPAASPTPTAAPSPSPT